MRLPKSLRQRVDPKAFAKADAAGWAFVLAATLYPPERKTGGLPDVPKGPMPDATTPNSTADTAVEAAARFATEDGLAVLAYFAIA